MNEDQAIARMQQFRDAVDVSRDSAIRGTVMTLCMFLRELGHDRVVDEFERIAIARKLHSILP